MYIHLNICCVPNREMSKTEIMSGISGSTFDLISSPSSCLSHSTSYILYDITSTALQCINILVFPRSQPEARSEKVPRPTARKWQDQELILSLSESQEHTSSRKSITQFMRFQTTKSKNWFGYWFSS